MKISAATTETGNLLYNPDTLKQARTIAVLVPGAFSRVSVFDAVQHWQTHGYGIASYRFPGLDGRTLSPALRIDHAGREIADLVTRYPGKPIRLLGFSTGSAVVLSAARHLSGDIKVAALSSAVECGGGRETRWRVTRDLLQAAWRARSLRRAAVWHEYYRVMLFGRAVNRDAVLDKRAREIIAARREKIVIPDAGLRRAHTADLRHWMLPPGAAFLPGRVRFFWGAEDPVFSRAQIIAFAAKLGTAPITSYPGQGHLLFASHPLVFADIFDFFEERLS